MWNCLKMKVSYAFWWGGENEHRMKFSNSVTEVIALGTLKCHAKWLPKNTRENFLRRIYLDID